MNRNCGCGGEFRRTDIKKVPDSRTPGGFAYVDVDKEVAHWACDRCGVERTQRKRQPASKAPKVFKKYTSQDATERLLQARIGSLAPLAITSEYLLTLQAGVQAWLRRIDTQIGLMETERERLAGVDDYAG